MAEVAHVVGIMVHDRVGSTSGLSVLGLQTSGHAPRADIIGAAGRVRNGPIAEVRRSMQQWTILHWNALVSCNFPFGAHPPTTHEDIRKLALQEDAAALDALANAAGVEDQFIRRTATEAIGRHPHGRKLRSIILRALRDQSEYVVRAACDVVARWELQEAHGLVVALLTNPSAATQQTAIRALGTIWVEADFPMMFRIYNNATENELRREAAWVLRQRATSAHWRTLFDAFQVDELARHRLWACELAEKFSGADFTPMLSQLSSDIDGHVRKAAAKAIQTLSSR